MRVYSDVSRTNDTYALPDVEVFELTAEEACERADEDTLDNYLSQFPLARMSGRERERMFQKMIDDGVAEGGWYYWFCFPGCMPDSEANGPYPTADAAIAAAREENS